MLNLWIVKNLKWRFGSQQNEITVYIVTALTHKFFIFIGFKFVAQKSRKTLPETLQISSKLTFYEYSGANINHDAQVTLISYPIFF